ncbi:hypothetical protein JCM24511_05636 [Saitozyma sp. JCM 24511]|nr:hypothetical protein JCM24511_05636 [Saitozyma sp. JCM 24511]
MSQPAPAESAASAPPATSTPIIPNPNEITTHPLAVVPSSTSNQGGASAGAGSERTSREVEPEVGAATPPISKVHLRVLIISGQSHVFSFEPEATVGRMKELIWSNWPSEWTAPAPPPSPAYLRVLHAGRILQDDSTLESNNLPATVNPTVPTVIHISVRSFSIRAEDDPKKGFLHPTTSRTRHASGEDNVGGCKCVIM